MTTYESACSANRSSLLRFVANPSGDIIRYPDRRLAFGWDPPIGTLTIMSREREPALVECRLGDLAVRHLAGLWGLRYLDLHGTSVTDESGPVLAGLTGLEHLLARAPSLRWVAINGTPAASSPRTMTLPRRPGVEFFEH